MNVQITKSCFVPANWSSKEVDWCSYTVSQSIAIAITIAIAVNWCDIVTDRTCGRRCCFCRCLRIWLLGCCLRIWIIAAVIAGIKVGPSWTVILSTFEPFHAICVLITITMVHLNNKQRNYKACSCKRKPGTLFEHHSAQVSINQH